MTRIIIVGDTHGCLDELHELIEKCDWKPSEDRLILAGDLVDRGPKSVALVQWARKNNVEIVRGNHDDRYVQLHSKMQWHAQNPKNLKPKWLKNYPDRIVIYKGLTEEDHKFLREAPTKIWLPEVKAVVVHAGFYPGRPLESQDEQTLMHVRFLYDHGTSYTTARLDVAGGYCQPLESFFWAEKYEGDWDVVYGHHVWDYAKIKIHENALGKKCYGIDTGCCFGGKLTAIVLTPGKDPDIVQVDSRQPKKRGNVA